MTKAILCVDTIVYIYIAYNEFSISIYTVINTIIIHTYLFLNIILLYFQYEHILIFVYIYFLYITIYFLLKSRNTFPKNQNIWPEVYAGAIRRFKKPAFNKHCFSKWLAPVSIFASMYHNSSYTWLRYKYRVLHNEFINFYIMIQSIIQHFVLIYIFFILSHEL